VNNFRAKKKMYNTQSLWNKTQKLNVRKLENQKSNHNFESASRSFHKNPKDQRVDPTNLPSMKIDKNDLKKSSIKLGESGGNNDLVGSHGNNFIHFGGSNKRGMNNSLTRVNNRSPALRNKNALKTNVSLGGHQKSQILNTSNSDEFKALQVSKDIRDKDQGVHDFMKKKNVHLGFVSNSNNSTTKSSFPNYNRKVINTFNGEIPMNRNLIKSMYLGSPSGAKKTESKLSMYGEKITNESNTAQEMNLKNKTLKRELLSHAFNLGYQEGTHRRGPSVDVAHHMRKNPVKLNESALLKQKNEKQNFKYCQDPSGRYNKVENGNYLNQRRYLSNGGRSKNDNDYWKSNFTFNQVTSKTGAGSFKNSPFDSTDISFKASAKSTKSGFSETNKYKKELDKKIQEKNKQNSTKSNFQVGFHKNDFSTSYKNQYLWKSREANV